MSDIKTKINKLLTEKFHKGVSVNLSLYGGEKNEYVEVYINPSKYEIDDIIKDSKMKIVRIASDKKQNIYAWKGDVIHHMMEKALDTFIFRLDYSPKSGDLIMSEGNPRDWDKQMGWKVVKHLKEAFPKVKKIVSIYGGGKAELKL